MPSPHLTSPRMQALLDQLQAGHTQAIADFWQHVAESGTPLIEASADDPASVLVTFVWRATTIVATVGLEGEIFGPNPATNQLYAVAGTDLWWRTYRFATDLRATYVLVPCPTLPDFQQIDLFGGSVIQAYFAHACLDPYNRSPFPEATPWASAFALPHARPEQWLVPNPLIAHGRVDTIAHTSSVLGSTRDLTIYTPPTYTADETTYPLVLVFDGSDYQQIIPLPTILDNLIAAQAIPPVIALFVSALNAEQREAEYACNPRFAQFVTTECLPWIHARYRISTDPQQCVAVGSSYGGLAAAYLALTAPDQIGKVVSLSGGFGWTPHQYARDQRYEPEWFARHIPTAREQHVHLYLAVGRYETTIYDTYMPTTLTCNRHLRTVLAANGYQVTYHEYAGAHDHLWWRTLVADGLCAVLGVRSRFESQQ